MIARLGNVILWFGYLLAAISLAYGLFSPERYNHEMAIFMAVLFFLPCKAIHYILSGK